MTAAIEAQALAAQSSVDFIRTIGFESRSEDASFGAVRQIAFTFSQRNTDTGADRNATLNVPLLTIVPIPYLRIEKMTVDFTSKITGEMIRTTKRDSSVDANGNLSVNCGNFLTPVKVGFKGSIPTKHSSSSATSNRCNTEHAVAAAPRRPPKGIPQVLVGVKTLSDARPDMISTVKFRSSVKSRQARAARPPVGEPARFAQDCDWRSHH